MSTTYVGGTSSLAGTAATSERQAPALVELEFPRFPRQLSASNASPS